MTVTGPGSPACPLCEGEGAACFSKREFLHYECVACQTIFVYPVPSSEELATYYRDAAGDQSSRLCWEGSRRHAHAAWRRALRDVTRLAGRGPILDVGCGAGQFLSYARMRGWEDLEGVEVSPAVATAGRAASGALIHELPFLDAPLRTNCYALVTLWDVLEHLPNPRHALLRVREVLRPGGVVVVGTPNRLGVTLRALGHRSFLIMPPEHLLLASRRGLKAAVTGVGLELERMDFVDIHLRDWMRFFRARSSGPDGELGRGEGGTGAARERSSHARAYETVTGSAAFGWIQALANSVLSATRLGDQLVMLARKPEAG